MIYSEVEIIKENNHMMNARIVAELSSDLNLVKKISKEQSYEQLKLLDEYKCKYAEKFLEFNVYSMGMGFDIKSRDINLMKKLLNDIKLLPTFKLYTIIFLTINENYEEKIVYDKIDFVSGILCTAIRTEQFMEFTEVRDGALYKKRNYRRKRMRNL